MSDTSFPPLRQDFKISTFQRKLTESARQHHYVTLPPGIPIGALAKPDVWSELHRFLRPHDLIEVQTEDFAYIAELVVVTVSKAGAQVRLRSVHMLGDPEMVEKQIERIKNFTIKWGTPKTKYRVHRNSDGKVVMEGLATRENAIAWLTDFLANAAQAIAEPGSGEAAA